RPAIDVFLDRGESLPERHRSVQNVGCESRAGGNDSLQPRDLLEPRTLHIRLMRFDDDPPVIHQAQTDNRANAGLVEKSLSRCGTELASAKGIDRFGDVPRVFGAVDGELYMSPLPLREMRSDRPENSLVQSNNQLAGRGALIALSTSSS